MSDPIIPTKKEAVYKAIGRRCGRQMPDSDKILRPNVLGIFSTSSKEEVAFLETLVVEGSVSKE
jgi:hypothetical protein